MPVPIRSVKFWINAFIPRVVPGYTRPVPAGPHVSKTMIPGPQRSPAVPAWVPGLGSARLEISDCYLTDQRAFSNDIYAKSRMHSEFRIDFTGSPATMSQWHNCDETTECDCEDGDVECHEKGATDRMKFELLAPARVASEPARPGVAFPSPGRVVTPPAGVVRVRMMCAASNPCAPTSRAFGDIDFHGTITISVPDRSIEFDIFLDQFPAFEAYATINDAAGVAMLQEMPPRGNTVMNLPGDADRPFNRKLQDRDGDGVFEILSERPSP